MGEQTIMLEIQGMTCEGCAQGITYALKQSKGIRQVKVDWRAGLGEVAFDTALTSPEEILADPVFKGHYSAQLSTAARP